MAAKADSEQRAPLPPIEKGAQADSTAADAAQQSPESQEPRPSRRWFRRSRRGEDASERAAEERSPPRHVRLIPRPSGEREANTDESVLRRTGERVEEK
jgi:hypothetical protein